MVWRYAGGELDMSRTHVMGIVNVTPDSFYDGGQYIDASCAVQRALALQEQGASIIDVGAQSTRPDCTVISPEEERARLEPVLGRLVSELRVPVSVDTFYPEVARWALSHGAAIINDVSGGLANGMVEVAAEYDAGLVMMHVGGIGRDGVSSVRAYFDQALTAACRGGLDTAQVCLDVGIGFGKTQEEDRQILTQLADITEGLPCAVMCGASRKRVTAGVDLHVPTELRLASTLAVHSLAQWNGARVLRVHDVAEAVRAAETVDLLLKQRRGANG